MHIIIMSGEFNRIVPSPEVIAMAGGGQVGLAVHANGMVQEDVGLLTRSRLWRTVHRATHTRNGSLQIWLRSRPDRGIAIRLDELK